MCAIAGFVNGTSTPPSEATLKRMTDTLSYRGPDDRGTEIIENCALGNCRLAVVDLSKRAHQPLWDWERQYAITYNGEIYNHERLRERLIHKGYRFRSRSDTEVIVNLYKAYGPESVGKLQGMFAFAIWDRQKRELFVARDPFGMKPLHYFLDEQVFIFASEIKAILTHPRVKKVIHPGALSHYFSLGFGCIASPQTIWRNIFKLPPGSWGIHRGHQFKVHPYHRWHLPETPSGIPLGDAVRQTRQLLADSVKRQLVADVPVGIFLSGGIDSSLVAALARRHCPKSVKTFSLGFRDRQYDESVYARRVASFLHTDHHHETCTEGKLLASIPDVTQRLDEPLGDPSLFPTYLLSKMTRRYVTVALSGDGGDELFAGYPTYIAHRIALAFHHAPSPIVEGLERIAAWLAPWAGYVPFMGHTPTLSSAYKMNRFFAGLNRALPRQYINFLGPMLLSDKDKLIRDHEETALPLVEQLLHRVAHSHTQTKLQYLDMMIYLAEDCLVKVDRASSYASLEVRVPMLDTSLAEFVLSLPSSYHLHGLTLKYLLKNVAADYLPQDIINRSKKGFGLPVGRWLGGALRPMLTSYLSAKKLKKQGLFHEGYVERLVREHISGRADHRTVLWNLLIFQLWYEHWIGRL